MQATTQTTFLELLGKLRDKKKTKLTILLIGKPQLLLAYSIKGLRSMYRHVFFHLNHCSAASDLTSRIDVVADQASHFWPEQGRLALGRAPLQIQFWQKGWPMWRHCSQTHPRHSASRGWLLVSPSASLTPLECSRAMQSTARYVQMEAAGINLCTLNVFGSLCSNCALGLHRPCRGLCMR